MFVTSEFPSEIPRIQTRNYSYTTTLYTIPKMKIGTKILILFFTLNLLSCKVTTQETEVKKPTTKFDFSKVEEFRNTKLTGQIINDYDNLFSRSEEKDLDEFIFDYNLKSTREIVIVTIKNIEPYSDIQKFSTDLANYWRIGNSEKNNGLIIVVCNPCIQIGIATGIGTELILTDEICKEVIEKTIIPELKKGKYFTAIANGVTELINKW